MIFYIFASIVLSVLYTKVKLAMVQFKAFFFHTKPRFPWASLANPSFFMHFPLIVNLPLPDTLHLLVFDFITFHSSGASLLTGQWFLAISLAMLSMVQLVSESLGVTQGLLCFAYNLLELALLLQVLFTLSTTSWNLPNIICTPYSPCPWLAEASPRPVSSSYILLLILL